MWRLCHFGLDFMYGIWPTPGCFGMGVALTSFHWGVASLTAWLDTPISNSLLQSTVHGLSYWCKYVQAVILRKNGWTPETFSCAGILVYTIRYVYGKRWNY
ncbi:MAG: hypothetical protein LUF85_14515 [Bacteroides sp.]|nr:hypothetical protein [Bacteroides sp.]